MKKVNHIKELSHIYTQPKKKISLVDAPPLNFLMINGTGDPNDNPDYSEAVSALYSVAYKLKFAIKKGPQAIDYKVMPLEGLWWAEDMTLFTLENRSNWHWSMMIMQPEYITEDLFRTTVTSMREMKELPKLDDLRFETYHEGISMQIFHLGPYGEGERETINKLHTYIETEGYQRVGKHHEIYFNSPLRTASENLKTIIRQPVETA